MGGSFNGYRASVLQDEKRSADDGWSWPPNTVTVRNTPQLHFKKKMNKMVNVMCTFTTIKIRV